MAGGADGNGRLDSTEKFTTDTWTWRHVGPLPVSARGLAGVTLDNTVYMMGGYAGVGVYYDTVWAFNTTSETWSESVAMSVPRAFHAVSPVTTSQLEQHCIN